MPATSTASVDDWWSMSSSHDGVKGSEKEKSQKFVLLT